MSGEHLYLGFVLANGDEYDFRTTKFNLAMIDNLYEKVTSELTKLIDLGVIANPSIVAIPERPEYQIIVFEECR